MSLSREELLTAFENPGFYPYPVQSIEKKETHISLVFLTGKYVYKIKKPVDFGFLDFTTLEKRKLFCQREITLNRRLTNNVYLDLLKITRKDSELLLGLNYSSEIEEYVIKMRQLSDEDTLLSLLKQNAINDDKIERLAQRLATFYLGAEQNSQIEQFGSIETITTNTEENFSQTESFVPVIIPEQEFQFIRTATRDFIKKHEPLFIRRIADGWIRDCHGDLRCEHIYFEPDSIQVIDCIEFNDRFRYSDVGTDLAFLLMDLDFQGYGGVGQKLLEHYVRASGDPDVFFLLDFYKCYRAYVRLKVSCFQMTGDGVSKEQYEHLMKEAKKFLNLASYYAEIFRKPTLWLICGLPASGKSTLAGEMASRASIPLFDSDKVRKELFGIKPDQRVDEDFGKGIYNPEASERTYARLKELGLRELEKGNSVILDATYGHRESRKALADIAERNQANFVIVHCSASLDTIRKRLLKRESKKTISDARLKHLNGHLKSFQEFTLEEDKKALWVDTEKEIRENVLEIFMRHYLISHSHA